MKTTQDVLEHLTKLRQMCVDRGCTVAEQETAARRIGYLLMEHLELHVVIELPRENETQRRPPSSWQETRRHQDENVRDEDPVELGFVCTLQTTDKAVLVSLPSRHRSRLRPHQAELWVPFLQLTSASRAAMHRNERIAWPLIVTREWARKMGLASSSSD